MSYDVDGNKLKKFKDIWYLKTSSNNDSLLPIRFIDEVAYLGTVDSNVTFTNNQNAKMQDVTFNGTSWLPFNPSQQAQYFMKNKLDTNGTKLPYWEIPILNNSGLITKELKGMITSRDRLPSNAIHYDTKIDGTGDGMLYYEIYVYYAEDQKTFSELYDLIDSLKMQKIYKSTEAHLYPTSIKGDGLPNKDIEIFQYGDASHTSIYSRIYPKSEDIGKKGFVFVFVQ